MKKFFSIILSMLMMCAFTLTACGKSDDGATHTCESKCSVCQLCTDDDCADSACSNKCQGHAPAAHTCESVCPTCNKCTDASCTETACADKCQGHAPAAHTCENVCPICGDCLDATCQEEVCREKCEEHGDSEMTAAQFVANTSNYLSEANEGISAAAAVLGSNVELSYATPIFPMNLNASAGARLLTAQPLNADGKDSVGTGEIEEMMMCAKCGEVEVPVSEKYCTTCKEGMSGPTTPTKKYSTGSELEQYIIFNSVARKIQLIVGETEYYTEHDFPFPNEYELGLIGTIKFEGELTKLLKEIEDYELSADGFYVIEEPYYQDGTFNPDTGEFDKDLGEQTLVYKRVRGYKLEGNTLITSSYTISYLYEETVSEEIYKEYTMDGNNFYYEKYKMVEGQKVVVDMFDIIKEEPNEDTFGDVYYVQMTLNGEEEITGMPAVYFEEAVDLADQWSRYVNEKMGTGLHTEVPTKVYLNGRIQKVDDDVQYELYYFRDYDYAAAAYESTCEIFPIEDQETWDGTYYYEYTRGNEAPLPASWENGFGINLGENLEGLIEDTLYLKYKEALVYKSVGNIRVPSEFTKYYPFEVKEYNVTLDVNDSYEIEASFADDAVYSYKSSNESVVTVDDSGGTSATIWSGDTEGEAIITVRRNNLIRYVRVLVRASIVNNSPEEMVIRLGTTQYATFSAYSNRGEMLEFSSDNEEIVTIDESGWITAHKEGATAVWAKASNGKAVKMLVYVTPSLDMTSLEKAEVELGESGYIPGTMHLDELDKIAITYDVALNIGEGYVMYFDNLDLRLDDATSTQFCRMRVNGNLFSEDVTMEFYYENGELVWNARSVVFNNAGNYKIEFIYDHQGGEYTEGETPSAVSPKEIVILEINVTVNGN